MTSPPGTPANARRARARVLAAGAWPYRRQLRPARLRRTAGCPRDPAASAARLRRGRGLPGGRLADAARARDRRAGPRAVASAQDGAALVGPRRPRDAVAPGARAAALAPQR